MQLRLYQTNLIENSFNFAFLVNKKYKTETGGQLFYPNKSFIKYDEGLKKEFIINFDFIYQK